MAIYTSKFTQPEIDAGIDKANSAYQKPPTGIPATDLANDVIPTPDEEDLTIANNAIKFKDRPNTDGVGRKILRKNMVSDVNTLTQSMITQTNTIYVIQYDFTLGEDITVPTNCVLEFDGGSISGNGVNKETIILSSNCGIYDYNLQSTNRNLYIEANNYCNIYGIKLFVDKEHQQHKEIILCDNKHDIHIDNVNSTSEFIDGPHYYSKSNLAIQNGSYNVVVSNSHFHNNIRINRDGDDGTSAPVLVRNSSHVLIEQCLVDMASGSGFVISGNSKHVSIINCIANFGSYDTGNGWSGIATTTYDNSVPDFITIDGCTVVGGGASAISFNSSNSILTNCTIRDNKLNAIAFGHPNELVNNSIISNCIIDRDKAQQTSGAVGIAAYINGNVSIDNVKFIGIENAGVKVSSVANINGINPSITISNCYFKNAYSAVNVEAPRTGMDSSELYINVTDTVCENTNYFISLSDNAHTISIYNNKINYCVSLFNASHKIKTVNIINNKVEECTGNVIYGITGDFSLNELNFKDNDVNNNGAIYASAPTNSEYNKEWIFSGNRFGIADKSSVIYFSGTYSNNHPIISFKNNIINNVDKVYFVYTAGQVASGVTLNQAYCELRDNILLNSSSSYGSGGTAQVYKSIYKNGNVVGGVVEVQS